MKATLSRRVDQSNRLIDCDTIYSMGAYEGNENELDLDDTFRQYIYKQY